MLHSDIDQTAVTMMVIIGVSSPYADPRVRILWGKEELHVIQLLLRTEEKFVAIVYGEWKSTNGNGDASKARLK